MYFGGSGARMPAIRLAVMVWCLFAGAAGVSWSACRENGPGREGEGGSVPASGWIQAMAFLSGTTEAEEMDSHTAEQFMSLLRHPLRINYSTRSRLTESGLFSPYQTASLTDYISRNGDVLSVAELAAVDGFGREYDSGAESPPIENPLHSASPCPNLALKSPATIFPTRPLP